MGSTNKTANLGLSQFIGTDKPTWLVDYNNDMSVIDEAIGELQNDSGLTDTAITELQTNVQNLQNGQGDSAAEIAEIKSDVQTLSANYETIHHETVILTEKVNETENGLEKCFPKTGGLIDGNLHVKKNQIVMFSTDVVKGVVPAESKYLEFRFQDSSDINTIENNLSRLAHASRNDGGTSLNMIISKNVANSTETARLEVGFDANGTPYSYAPTPAEISDKSSHIATTKWVYELLESLGLVTTTETTGE